MQGCLMFNMKSQTALLTDMKWLTFIFMLFSMFFWISSLLHCWTTALGKQLPSPWVISSNIMCSWHLEMAFMISNAISAMLCSWINVTYFQLMGAPINGNKQWPQSSYLILVFSSSNSSFQIFFLLSLPSKIFILNPLSKFQLLNSLSTPLNYKLQYLDWDLSYKSSKSKVE